MITYETIMGQFDKFGFVDIVMRSPLGAGSSRIRWELIICLQAPEEKGQTDSDYRRAAFELSEQAIAFARSKYHLVSAPRYSTTGELQVNGDICLIDARLELEFIEQ